MRARAFKFRLPLEGYSLMWSVGFFGVKNIPYFVLRIFLVGRSGWLYVQREFLFCCTTLRCCSGGSKEFSEVLELISVN